MEQQTGLQGRQRPHLGQGRESPFPAVDIDLTAAHQREIRRGMPARADRLRMARNRFQCADPQRTEFAHPVGVQQCGRVTDPGRQPVTGDRRVDVQRRHRRQVGVVGALQVTQFGCRDPAEATQRLGHRAVGKPAEIIEADLAGHLLGQLTSSVRVQVAQQPVTDTLTGHRQQLLLHGLDHTAHFRATG